MFGFGFGLVSGFGLCEFYCVGLMVLLVWVGFGWLLLCMVCFVVLAVVYVIITRLLDWWCWCFWCLYYACVCFVCWFVCFCFGDYEWWVSCLVWVCGLVVSCGCCD